MEGFELQLGLAKGGAVKVIKACHIWETVMIEQGSLRVNSTSSHSALALRTQCLFSHLVARWLQQRPVLDQSASVYMLR